MELFKANQQWANRPADERFETLEEMHAQCKAYAATAAEAEVPFSSLRAEAQDGEVILVGKENVPALLTNYSFGQLASRAGAPAGYLAKLPATLAVQNINHGLKARAAVSETDSANLLIHQNGKMVLRAITSDKYSRIWNYEVTERLLELQARGWRPAKPTMHWGQNTVGTCIQCSGTGKGIDGAGCDKCKGTGRELPALYASDRDMWAFLMIENQTIQQPVATAKDAPPMRKGLIYWNSEVGDRTIGVMKFMFNEMCGNHIIWGASDVCEFKARHVGRVHSNLYQFEAEIRRYANESLNDLDAKFKLAASKRIESTKEGLLDYIFGKRILTRSAAEAAYNAVRPIEDGDPLTVWGFAQGLTRYSQTVPYANVRHELDRAAAKVLKIAF